MRVDIYDDHAVIAGKGLQSPRPEGLMLCGKVPSENIIYRWRTDPDMFLNQYRWGCKKCKDELKKLL